jgi:hypothetical protein
MHKEKKDQERGKKCDVQLKGRGKNKGDTLKRQGFFQCKVFPKVRALCKKWLSNPHTPDSFRSRLAYTHLTHPLPNIHYIWSLKSVLLCVNIRSFQVLSFLYYSFTYSLADTVPYPDPDPGGQK